ncbi:MAG: hypothetical protein WBQ78_17230 [Gammaproteobacteria bacterium]
MESDEVRREKKNGHGTTRKDTEGHGITDYCSNAGCVLHTGGWCAACTLRASVLHSLIQTGMVRRMHLQSDTLARLAWDQDVQVRLLIHLEKIPALNRPVRMLPH